MFDLASHFGVLSSVPEDRHAQGAGNSKAVSAVQPRLILPRVPRPSSGAEAAHARCHGARGHGGGPRARHRPHGAAQPSDWHAGRPRRRAGGDAGRGGGVARLDDHDARLRLEPHDAVGFFDDDAVSTPATEPNGSDVGEVDDRPRLGESILGGSKIDEPRVYACSGSGGHRSFIGQRLMFGVFHA